MCHQGTDLAEVFVLDNAPRGFVDPVRLRQDTERAGEAPVPDAD